MSNKVPTFFSSKLTSQAYFTQLLTENARIMQKQNKNAPQKFCGAPCPLL
jgi:hypothetical protein